MFAALPMLLPFFFLAPLAAGCCLTLLEVTPLVVFLEV
jgi:hypothetical protein